MQKLPLLAALVSSLAVFAAAPNAHAAPPDEGGSAGIGASAGSEGASASATAPKKKKSSNSNRFRIGVDTEFMGFSHFEGDFPGEDNGVNSFGFGVGRTVPVQQTIAGVSAFGAGPTPLLGLSFGALILDSRALVGARLTFSLMGQTTEADDDIHARSFNGELIPYFRWLFGTQPLRPYIEGHFGLGGGVVRLKDTSPTADADNDTVKFHRLTPTVGAGGGIMYFVNEHVSLDAGLNLDYAAPHTRTTVETEMAPFVEDTEWDHLGNNISVSLLAGISGWF